MTCPKARAPGAGYRPPGQAPYILARFLPRQCDPCPSRALCTRGPSARVVCFLPQHLHELQARNRADQHDPQWRHLYAARSGVEGTVDECVNSHRLRRCRYHGMAKTHLQHVLTAIAINIERLSAREPAVSAHRPRPPTAFQQYLDTRNLPPTPLAAPGQMTTGIRIPDRVVQRVF